MIQQFLLPLTEWMGAIAVGLLLGLSPALKNRVKLGFRYANREGSISLSLFALVFVFAFQYFAGDWFTRLFPSNVTPELAAVLSRMVLALISLIPFILALVLRGQPLRSAGWDQKLLRPGLQMGFGLALITILLHNKISAILSGLTVTQAYALLACLGLAVAEETIFRGYIHLRFSAWLGERWGWLATAGLWTLWQLPGRLWFVGFDQIWPVLLISAVQGLILGWLMNKTGHTVATVLYRAVSGWMAFL